MRGNGFGLPAKVKNFTPQIPPLQVTVKHIHIRIEDRRRPLYPLTLGLVLDELALYTVDKKGNKSFVVDPKHCYKQVVQCGEGRTRLALPVYFLLRKGP